MRSACPVGAAAGYFSFARWTNLSDPILDGGKRGAHDLCVVDRILFEPTLILHVSDAFQCARDDACAETAVPRGDTDAETDSAAHHAEHKNAHCGFLPISQVATCRADARSRGRKTQGASGRLRKERNEACLSG